MELWSWILTAVGVSGLYLAGSHNRFGWIVGLCAQVLWFIFGFITHQYGFILSAFVYGFVYLRNFVKWRSSQRDSEEVVNE